MLTPPRPSVCLQGRGMPTITMHLGNFQPAKVGNFQTAQTGEFSTGIDITCWTSVRWSASTLSLGELECSCMVQFLDDDTVVAVCDEQVLFEDFVDRRFA